LVHYRWFFFFIQQLKFQLFINFIAKIAPLKKIHLLLLFHLIIGIITIIYFNGTGDAGDSVYHYLFAKYAPNNPELYFDHWAKPLYVFIASPFAQIGFIGVKILNLLVVNGTLWLTYLVAKKLNVKHAWLTALILIFSPLYFILTFSGLTEPLFAFLLVLSLYFFFNKKLFWACLIISFLPYLRSEGLFFIGIFGAYFIYLKNWRSLLTLTVGSIVYGFAGYPFYNDLLWVFNKVPYAKMSSTYGSGDPFHFVLQLQYVIGIPIYILFWLGILAWFVDLIKKKITMNITYFIYGSVFAFILAHSIFWYYGIFNSMGLKRVLICVVPLIGIIALKGFNLIYEFQIKPNLQKVLSAIFIIYLVIFPITSNPAAIDFEHDLSLNLDQKLAIKVTQRINNIDSGYNRLFTSHPFMCETLNINCFDESRKKDLDRSTLNEIKKGDIIVWESWFSVVEHGIQKEVLDKNPRFELLYNISETNYKGRTIEYSLYIVR
jgi:hypothetical protein